MEASGECPLGRIRPFLCFTVIAVLVVVASHLCPCAQALASSSSDNQELNFTDVLPSLPVLEDETASVSADQPEGFQSLDSMLNWAIEHSDPEALREHAQQASRITAEELALKRQHIKDVMDAMKMPSDAEMMSVALADVRNKSATEAQLLRALAELRELVEPIDNANDLVKLGGLPLLQGALGHAMASVRTAAAWALGVAVQNNPEVQKELLDGGILVSLVSCMHRGDVSEEEASKCFYALSGALRNHVAAQQWFIHAGGVALLTDILQGRVPAGTAGSVPSSRLKKKAVFLIGDLAEQACGTGDDGPDNVPGRDDFGDDSGADAQEHGDKQVKEPIVWKLNKVEAEASKGGARRARLAEEEEEEEQPVLALGGPTTWEAPRGVAKVRPGAVPSKGQVKGDAKEGKECSAEMDEASRAKAGAAPRCGAATPPGAVQPGGDGTTDAQQEGRRDLGCSTAEQPAMGRAAREADDAHSGSGERRSHGFGTRGTEGLWNREFLEALVFQLEPQEGSTRLDLDLVEKVLHAFKSFARLNTCAPQALRALKSKDMKLQERLSSARIELNDASSDEESDQTYNHELVKLLDEVASSYT